MFNIDCVYEVLTCERNKFILLCFNEPGEMKGKSCSLVKWSQMVTHVRVRQDSVKALFSPQIPLQITTSIIKYSTVWFLETLHSNLSILLLDIIQR